MRGEDATVRTGHPGDLRQLVALREAARRVDQAGREADRARLERLGGLTTHLSDGARAQHVVGAVGGQPQRVMAHQECHVVGGSVPFHGGKELGERRRRDVNPAREPLVHRPDQLGGIAGHRSEAEPAVPGDLGGDPLQQFERLRIVHQRDDVAMGVRVDEARGHEEPVAGNLARAGHVHVADLADPAVGHDDVAGLAGRAETIEDDATAQNERLGHPCSLPWPGSSPDASQDR